MLAVEADGAIHATEPNRAYNAWRDETIGAQDVLILRFTNDRIEQDLPTVLAEIEVAITQRRRDRAKTQGD